jgi:hypothetical protein
MKADIWRGGFAGLLHGEIDEDLHRVELDGAMEGELAGDLHGEELDGAVDGELAGGLHGEELNMARARGFVAWQTCARSSGTSSSRSNSPSSR